MAAAAAVAAPATASAQAMYPTGTGLIAVSADGESATMWPDGSNFNDTFAQGTVGTFDGSGNNLSLGKGSIVSQFSLISGQVISNQPAEAAVQSTAMSPAGNSLATVAGGTLKTLVSAFTWSNVDPAVGRFGWATQPGNQRLVYVAGPGAVNGGGQDIAGSVVVREQDGNTWIATSDEGAKNATVSPDGRWIAYEKDNGIARDIWLYDTNTDGAPFKLADQTDIADEYLPTFSPNSQELIYAKSDEGRTEVRRIPVTAIGTSALVKSFDLGGLTSLAWQPSIKATAGTLEINTTDSPQVGTSVPWVGNANGGYKPIVDKIVWQRCPAFVSESDGGQVADGEGCVDVKTGEEYTPVNADVGYRLRIRREVANPAGSSIKYSEKTALVVALPAGQPVFTKTPGKRTNQEMPAFEWTAGENGGSEYECRVVVGFDEWRPDTGWAPCTAPAQTPPLTNGDYTFLVRHKGDGNGVAVYEFTVDQDPPAKPEIIRQSVKDLDASVTFTTGSNEEVTLECRLDAAPQESGPEWEPCPAVWSRKGLAEGPHRLEITAVDKAGNRSEAAIATWTNTKPAAPVVEEPKPQTPAQPETPAVQTPAVEVPAAPVTPKAEEPKKETPKPVVTPVKPRELTVSIGGTKTGAQTPGGTASAATIEVAKESVGVGCSITGTVLKSCKVDLYAPRAAGARAQAAASSEVLVGTGTYESKAGSSKMEVRIDLNATGKAMLRKSPGGLKVSVKITGKPVSGAPLKATGVAKLVTDRASATVGGFAVNSPVLTAAAKRQLRTLAKFGKADTIRCVGHTDGSSDDESYLKGLGLERAKAVCAYLTAHGAKGARVLVSRGKARPAATNATAAGRAKNRRVQVTLVR
jgi:outer membrane protein OmpA-like peptidoglycan-associated protein